MKVHIPNSLFITDVHNVLLLRKCFCFSIELKRLVNDEVVFIISMYRPCSGCALGSFLQVCY